MDQETQKAKPIVESIMYPSRTVMDFVSEYNLSSRPVLNFQSLALALWFASRGVGTIKAPRKTEAIPYASTARVLLNGLGSDELLGGYGRHRSAFKLGGWTAVIEEVCW